MKMYLTFWNLEGILIRRKMGNQRSNDYKFKKVRYISKYPDCVLDSNKRLNKTKKIF